MRLRSLVLLPVAVLLAAGVAAPAAASPEERAYVVVLKDEVSHPSDVAAEHRRKHGAEVTRTYGTALKGYAATLTASAYGEVVRDPRVAYVEPDVRIAAAELAPAPGPAPASWGLDRVDQRGLPLSGTYAQPATPTAVIAYVVDSGIEVAHPDFDGRALHGYDALGGSGQDCNGHGTHVAGTVGGTRHGVAAGVRLVGVRVLDCAGSGALSAVVAGLDWVTRDHDPGEPAVVNLSLGGGASRSIDNAVKAAVADGLTVVVAAGNSGANACNYSPARVPEAITVGATTSTDARAAFSNYGSCLDLFAPGAQITSSWIGGAVRTIDGTSMAAPHVAGAAALHLQAFPAATPAAVRDALHGAATKCVVTSSASANNHLLHVGTQPDTAACSTTAPSPKTRK